MIDRKHLSQRIAFGTFRLLSLTVVGILFAILGFIIYKGIGVINWEFLTTAPTDGMTAGLVCFSGGSDEWHLYE